MRILTVAWGVPFPPAGGGLARTFHLLRALSEHHSLILAAFTYGSRPDEPSFPIRVEAVPWEWSRSYSEMANERPDVAARAAERLTFEVDEPWFVSCLNPSAMESRLRQLRRERFDAVLLEGTPAGVFIDALPPDVPRVLDLFDVHSLLARREADRTVERQRRAFEREAQRVLQFETRVVQRCDLCLAVSAEEAAAARTLLHPPSLEIVPNGVDTSHFTPQPGSEHSAQIVFTGKLNYAPNADAARWVAEDILPLVRREMPDARLQIVGADPAPEVTTLAGEAVTVHRDVPDIRPYLWQATVAVVPVRHGGGTRLKLLEAAASGKPIVTTRLGAEGLAFQHGEDVLVADEPHEFAAWVLDLLRNPRLRARLSERARQTALRYDWLAIGTHFRALVERTVEQRRARSA
jgi:glycosyltransferase involved in cell wall biosynthesis